MDNCRPKVKSDLKYVLLPLFKELEARGLTYCVCGNYHELPDYTSHDVDIWCEDTRKIEKILFDIAKINGFFLYLHSKTANGSNNFFYKISNESKNEIIRIDILYECAWSSFIPLVKSEKIKDSRKRYKNFYVANEEVETSMHFLYPLIAYGKIKEKYKEKIYRYRKNQTFISLISEALGRKTADLVLKRIDQTEWDAIESQVLRYKTNLAFRGIRGIDRERIIHLKDFIITNLCRLIKPAGLFIAFIGPDGSGKTTVVDKLESFFNQAFISDKVKKYYWRPFFFPPLRHLLPFHKEDEIEYFNNNKKKRNNIKLSFLNAPYYLFKLFYYWSDFVIGRIKYQSAWSRGGIVTFDRYYHDHIIYPQRFGFIVPPFILNLFLKYIPKPDLIFYLFAPPEIIIKRKEEFAISEITRQINEYEQMCLSDFTMRKIDTTLPIDEVINNIVSICLEYMADREQKRGSDG